MIAWLFHRIDELETVDWNPHSSALHHRPRHGLSTSDLDSVDEGKFLLNGL